MAYQGRIGCFEARGGEQAWARELASSRGLSMDAKGVYSTADDGSIWAFDPDTGRNLWKQDALRYRNVTAPVKLGNNLLAVDGEGYAHLLSPVDGQIVGRSQLKVEGTIARPLVLGNIAYVLDTNGTLSAVTL
ncbi:Outer membrane protein assembly factor BamB precursor [compost metagenome]